MLGKMRQFGFGVRQEAMVSALAEEITKSNEIEGELLNSEQVRSSIAKRLNISPDKEFAGSRRIDGIVESMMDAACNFAEPLTQKRLFGWHAALFPAGHSGMQKIRVAAYRTNTMQVVSGKRHWDVVHYEAPPPAT